MKKLCRILSALCLVLYCADSRAQLVPLFPTPPGMSVNSAWISDGSSESPILPHSFINTPIKSNTGTVLLNDITPTGLVRRSKDLSFDIISDGSNGHVVAYQSHQAVVDEDPVSQNATYSPGGSHIYARSVNSSGTVIWETQIDAGGQVVSLPRIVANGLFYYVAYKVGALGSQTLRVAQVTASSGAVNWDIQVSPASYYNIPEYSLCAETSGTEDVALAYTYQSASGGPEVVYAVGCDASTTIHLNTIVDNVPLATKWNPLVVYNAIRNQVEVFWGDDQLGVGSEHLFVQGYQPALAYAKLYTVAAPPGIFAGQIIWDAPCVRGFEFYALPCPGYGSPDQGVTDVFFKDNVNTATLNTYLINGAGSPGRFAQFTSNGSNPAGLINIANSLTSSDPIVSYVTTGNKLRITRLDFTTNVAYSTPGASSPTITSARYRSPMGVNSTGLYVAMPDVNQYVLFKINPTKTGTGPSVTSTSTIPLRSYIATSFTDDAYIGGVVNSSNFTVLEFAHGIGQIPTVNYFNSEKPDVEGENKRVKNSPYTDLRAHVFAIPATPPFSSYYTVDIQRADPQNAPHIAAYQNLTATVFEHLNDNGTSDIWLAHRDPATGVDMPPIAITSALTAGATYTQPKVAVTYDIVSNRNVALVTYVKEVPLTSSQMCYQIVGIDGPGGGTMTDVAMDGATFGTGNRVNYDIIYDPTNVWFIPVYVNKTAPNYEVRAAGIDPTGTMFWNTLVSASNSDIKKQVRACYNPDPGVEGAYIVWKQSSVMPAQDVICLNGVRSGGGGFWLPGLTLLGNMMPNHRYEPVVAASQNWVMAVWADEQDPTATTPVPRIFGCAFSNTGALQPGWITAGVEVSAVTTPYAPGTHTAFEPDIAPTLTTGPATSQGCLIAFSEEDAGFWAPAIFNNTVRRIGVRFIPVDLTGGIPSQHHLVFAPTNGFCDPSFVPSDLANSMYGYQQRKPKLTMMQADPLKFETLGNYVLCSFETESYSTVGTGTLATSVKTDEVNSYNNDHVVFVNNNITARVISPDGAMSMVDINIGRGSNAQELGNVVFTPNFGPLAAYTDYNLSDNHAGNVRIENVNWETRFTPDFAAAGINWDLPVTHLPGDIITQNAVIYNNSLWPLCLTMINANTSSGFGTYSTIPPPAYIPPVGSLAIPVDHQHSNPKHSVDYLDFNVDAVFMDVNAVPGPPVKFICTNGTGWGKYGTGAELANAKNFQVSIAPNPATNHSTVTLDGLKDHQVKLQLMNLLGEVVKDVPSVTMASDHTSLSFDMNDLPSGNYILRATQDEGSRSSFMLSIQK